LKKLRTLENQGCIKLQVRNLNDAPTSLIAHFKRIKTPSVRVIYEDGRTDTIIEIENLKMRDLEKLMTQKRAAMRRGKMRKSTKYLMWMPAIFAGCFGLSFAMWTAFFMYFESQAAAHGPIYAELTFYVVILALLPAFSALMAMTEIYIDMRFAETHMMRYLKKLNVQPAI
ncbi:MAG: hypothetical protein Q7J68_01825, partial [Thermoplasmata archaeon]|nr:hypothetical protein [Thermoplasmata archaeon]